MKYVCEAPGGNTWFRIETEAEAASESDGMRHAVEKFFRKEQEKATQTFHPLSKVFFEQEIGLKAHIQREMPLFLTLRPAPLGLSRSRGLRRCGRPASSARCFRAAAHQAERSDPRRLSER